MCTVIGDAASPSTRLGFLQREDFHLETHQRNRSRPVEAVQRGKSLPVPCEFELLIYNSQCLLCSPGLSLIEGPRRGTLEDVRESGRTQFLETQYNCLEGVCTRLLKSQGDLA